MKIRLSYYQHRTMQVEKLNLDQEKRGRRRRFTRDHRVAAAAAAQEAPEPGSTPPGAAQKRGMRAKKWLRGHGEAKAKRWRPDLDEIHHELRPQVLPRPWRDAGAQPDPDLPGGGGLHRCLACSRYFIDSANLKTHLRSKDHKKRLKQLSVDPYTQEEAERAAGMGSYVPSQRLAVPTEVFTEVPETDTSA
ncbi:Zinc finger protein 593 [Myotis davidii]|uniref:Zinc finger protein 593 n=1 Tax=Myotis davidii TaxID=225400 RepID=L5MHE2_MYODS|nr:Zinc finger protein 593 [Myotis davidii]